MRVLVCAIVVVGFMSGTALAVDLFVDSGQRLGSAGTWQVAAGDLDRDGDIDVVAANIDSAAVIWLNDGSGQFTDSGQRLEACSIVGLADLDGDGALDVITALWGGPLSIWWNDGAGGFSDGGPLRIGGDSLSFAVGDLNGDGAPDIYLGCSGSDQLWLNRGSRAFRSAGYRLGGAPTGGVAMADMDGDGDMDVVAAGWDEPGHVWLNDGDGRLTAAYEFDVVAYHVHGIALADADGDGDLDAFFALAGGLCCRNVWLNDGTGWLDPLDFDFGTATAQSIAVADLNGDGLLDVALGIGGATHERSRIWLGVDGGFVDSGLRIGTAACGGVALADFDADGDLDLFAGFNVFQAGTWDYLPCPNQVWFNTTAEDDLA